MFFKIYKNELKDFLFNHTFLICSLSLYWFSFQKLHGRAKKHQMKYLCRQKELVFSWPLKLGERLMAADWSKTKNQSNRATFDPHLFSTFGHYPTFILEKYPLQYYVFLLVRGNFRLCGTKGLFGLVLALVDKKDAISNFLGNGTTEKQVFFSSHDKIFSTVVYSNFFQ